MHPLLRAILRFAASCQALAAALPALAGEPAADPVSGKSVADLSWEFATQPVRCFELAGEDQFEGRCRWLIYDRLSTWRELAERYGQKGDFWLLCRLARGTQVRTVRTCRANPRVRQMDVYPDASPRSGPRIKPVTGDRRERLREQATAYMDAAQSLDAMIDLVGDLPDDCLRLPDGGLVCQWSLLQTTPGWVTIARWGDMPDKKLRLVCRFPSATGPRGEDSCKVSLID